MRLISNPTLIDRNTRIGKYAFGGGTVLLIGALGLNIYAISQPEAAQARLIVYVFGAFLVGYTLTTLGTAFNNRWGRRPDKALNDALRGLDDRWSIYHYRLGASHVLVGPGGVFTLVPKYQFGPITFDNGKWQNPGARRGLFGLFASDTLGNPGLEAKAEVESFGKFMEKHAAGPPVEAQPLVVFMSPKAVLQTDKAPVTALHFKQLKDFLRRRSKGATLAAEQLADIEQKLGVSEGDA